MTSRQRDWKDHHTNEAGKALERPVVKEAMQKYAGNMGFKLDGLPEYGLMKVAMYAAQVARAEALGFDPDLLLLSAEEADRGLLDLAEAAALAGKPVWVIAEEWS